MFHRKEAKRIKQQLINRYLMSPVLDIGYHQSPNLFAKDFYGLDYYKDKTPEGYVEVRQCDLNNEKIPYEEDRFRSIVSIDTIEHLQNPIKLFYEANKILKNDGLFIISIPNPYYWKEIWNNIFNRYKNYNDIAHINLLTIHSIKNLCYWSGFTLERVIGFGFPIPFTRQVLNIKSPTLAYYNIFILRKKNKNKFSILNNKIE